jgi:hypothetical protein
VCVSGKFLRAMRNFSIVFVVSVVLLVSACDEPAPVPMDVVRAYPDIQMIPIDGMQLIDLPPLPDVDDERVNTCLPGGWRPCDCGDGTFGRDYCVSRRYEGMCRCGDAGPPVTDARVDAVDDVESDASRTDAGAQE